MTKRILFVDDENNVLSGLRRMLRGQRIVWDMQFASSGPEALDIMKTSSFDVIVTDMRMPIMDGAELLTHVSRLYPKTVRLVLSGQSEHERIFRSIGPAHQFMSKPCDPDVLVGTIDRACNLQDNMQDEAIKQIVSQVAFLPSLPGAYRELLVQLDSEHCSMDQIGELIGRDLALSAKVLQLVNSAFFGLPQHVSCPRHAASLLGLNIIRPLVLIAGTYAQCEEPKLDGYTLDSSISHSLAVATTARRVAASENGSTQTIDDSFIAGMMHDIGKLILAVNMREPYQEAIHRARSLRLPLWKAEQEWLGTTHAEIGAHLLGLWGLPNSVVEAVAFHHRPGKSLGHLFSPLTAVHIANALHTVSLSDPAAQSGPTDWDEDYLRAVGVSTSLSHWRQIVAKEPAT